MFSWQDSPPCKTHKGRRKATILKCSWQLQSFLTIFFVLGEAANAFYSRVFPFMQLSYRMEMQEVQIQQKLTLFGHIDSRDYH